MNTRLVNSAAGVINAALQQNRTAAGIALALESTQMLMTPETAAELEKLRAERAALVAMLPTGPLPAVMLGEGPVLRAERAVWEQVAGVLGVELPAQPARSAGEDVRPQVAKLRALLAGQREVPDGEHFVSVHHDYRTPHDLPETGGAQ